MSQPLREVSNLASAIPGDTKHRQAARIIAGTYVPPPPPQPQENSYRASAIQRGGYSFMSSQSSISSVSMDSTIAAAGSGRLGVAVGQQQQQQRFSPKVDARHAADPIYCSDLIGDIADKLNEREYQAVRRFNEGADANQSSSVIYRYYASPHYLRYQPEVNEKMRMILIDWLIDVHLKFKLHPETMYLAVNIIDRYLSCNNTKHNAATFVPRGQLQLVGVSAMLLAAKYEEIWPPEVKECVHISANTYTREEIIHMERDICTALSFRLTVPTPFPFATRLFTVLDGEDLLGTNPTEEVRRQQHSLLRHASCFFMEHALLDYKCLQFTPSQVASASVFLALVSLYGHCDVPLPTRAWPETLRHYSRAEVRDFRGCAEVILEYVNYVPTTKYQAVRRKYVSSRYGEVAKVMMMPNELPHQ